MLDLAEELHRWVRQGREFAVATVVATNGSSPRQPGAALAVDSDGTAIGPVSGGCVEGAVYELCRQALTDGESVVERFGYSDADAFAVGLTRGGVIDILVTPVRGDAPHREVLSSALAAAAQGAVAALARITEGPPEHVGRALLVHPDGTYEGGLGGHSGLDLVDGTGLVLPREAYWFEGPGRQVENHGVAPDVEVPHTPRDWAESHDPN